MQDRCGETTQLSIRAGEFTGDTLVQPRLSNPDIALPTGQKTYQDSIAGRQFRVASPSFFQVNVEQAARVAEVVRQSLDLKKTDLLVDAYMGVGAFAALLASHVRKVIGIEESSAAVADAKENIKDLGNVELALGKTEAVLGTLEERPDAVVLDPPRAGCQAGALEALLRLLPPRIAYVSATPRPWRGTSRCCAGTPIRWIGSPPWICSPRPTTWSAWPPCPGRTVTLPWFWHRRRRAVGTC